MTLTHTPTLTLSTALEAFAVRLESRDEGAWQTLLSQVSPVFGDPTADRVAHLMQTYKDDGEYDSELIRKMLSEKADLATALPSEARLLCRPEDDVAEEAFEVEVEEVQWRGRTYLVADDGALFDDAYYRVGTWSDHAVAGSAPVWSEKAAAATAPPSEARRSPVAPQTRLLCRPEDDVAEETDSGRIGGWDGGEDSDEDELAWTARRTRYLESLDKNVLIDMINMPEYERDDLIGDNM
jgi:hypothetical protein